MRVRNTVWLLVVVFVFGLLFVEAFSLFYAMEVEVDDLEVTPPQLDVFSLFFFAIKVEPGDLEYAL